MLYLYKYKGALADTSKLFGQGASRIVARNFGCTGEEIKLGNCSHNTVSLSSGANYQTYVPAGVICQGNTSAPTECNHSDVWLVNGLTETEGRVEVCAYGYWALVCGIRGNRNVATRLICKQLGLPTEGSSMICVHTVLYMTFSL